MIRRLSRHFDRVHNLGGRPLGCIVGRVPARHKKKHQTYGIPVEHAGLSAHSVAVHSRTGVNCSRIAYRRMRSGMPDKRGLRWPQPIMRHANQKFVVAVQVEFARRRMTRPT